MLHFQQLMQERNDFFTDADNVIDYLIESPDTPARLDAVIGIIDSDPLLKKHVIPCIDIQNKTIDWFTAFNHEYDEGQTAALCFAKSLWDQRSVNRFDVFKVFARMSSELKTGCAEAMCRLWQAEVYF